jgi:hypothetical protein
MVTICMMKNLHADYPENGRKREEISTKKIKLDIGSEAIYKARRIPVSDGDRGAKLDTDILKCKAGRHVLKRVLTVKLFLPSCSSDLVKNLRKGGCILWQKVQ